MKPRRCRECGVSLRGQQMFFCSKRCADLGKIIVRSRPCERCSKGLTRDQINDRGRFCSRACANKSRVCVPERDCPACGQALRREQLPKRIACCSVACARSRLVTPAPMRSAVLAVLRANLHAWLTVSDLAIWVCGDDTPADSRAVRQVFYHLRRDGYVLATRRATWAERVQGQARAYRLISEPSSETGRAVA